MRAANMQAMTNDVVSRWPGVVVYGIGDAAHRLEVSDHNEDDTVGSKAAQSDSDSTKEHRAIDIMLGTAFTKADGDALVAALLADPAARARLYYIIWYGHIWSRSSGWVRKTYTGSDPHTNHVHVSGLAADDENTAGWPAIRKGGVRELFCAKGATNDPATKALQVRLKNLDVYTGAVDGDYGDGTKAALRKACVAISPTTTADGSAFDHYTMWYVERLEHRKDNADDTKPLLDRIVKLEAALKALPAPAPAPAPSEGGLTLPATVRVTGGMLTIEESTA